MKFMNTALKSLLLSSAVQPAYSFGRVSSSCLRRSVLRGGSMPYSQCTSLSMSQSKASFPSWTFDKPCTTIEWNELSSISLSATTDISSLQDSELVVVGIFAPLPADDDDDDALEEGADPPVVSLTGKAKELDDSIGGILTEVINDNAKTFKAGAKAGAMTPTIRVANIGEKTKRYVVLGLGKRPKNDEKKGESVGISLGKAIASKVDSEKKIASCSILLPEVLSEDSVLTDLSSAIFSSLYSDNRYRTGDKIKKVAEDLKSISFVAEGELAANADEALEIGKRLSKGIILAKDIVNSPHNALNSLSLAETAKRIAAESDGLITCQILDKVECEKRGMGAYLGVARGSETEPQFIHLTYSPKTSDIVKKVGIVGKGLLFDTGGYNIKTTMMELMKFDCGGSAAVLGAARAVAALAPEGVEAHFIVAACENMINERSVVPSDILTASNGKTIEVGNTDAEGRLTLADALVFADKEIGCESIIELSTLTGACMVSLGKSIAGVWTANDDLATEIADISKLTGEKSWRMPLESSYNEQLESKIADISNIGSRYGGAITAALFLQNFVNKKKPFAHIDIAGPVWNDKTGATGYGTRLVAEWVKRQGTTSSN